MKYGLVVFDMDGTILDTLQDLTDSLNHVLRLHSYPEGSPEQVRGYIGNGIRRLVELGAPAELDADSVDSLFSEYMEYYRVHCADKTRPYDGVIETIEQLRARGIRTAVVSNKTDAQVKELCERYFDGLFDAAAGEREGVRRKPAPDSVNEVRRLLDIGREDTVYVGDSDVDVKTAANAGVDCVSVLWGYKDRAYLVEHGAVCFAESPKDILNYVN